MSAKKIFQHSTGPDILKLLVVIVFGMWMFQIHLHAQPEMDSQQERKLKPDSVSAESQPKERLRGRRPIQDKEQNESFTQLYNYGLDLLNNNQPDSAIAYLQKASAIAKDHPKVMTNLARAYVDIKEFEKAQHLVDRAISKDSSDADAYRVKGRIMQSVGNQDQAIDAYQRSLELDSDNPYAHNNLALVYIQQERFNDAILLLEKAVQRKDDVPFFYNNLGVAHEALGNYQQSKQAFQTALSLDSNYEKADINLKRVEQRIMQEAQKDSLIDREQQAEALR